MLKKVIFTSFLISSLIVVIYPHKKENTKLFDYCYSLEKIISKNSIQKRKNISRKFISIYKDIAEIGVKNTKGRLINKMINQYKISKNTQILNIIPNQLYCLGGYWIETVKTGTFESLFYKKGKKVIDEYKDLRYEVEGFLNDINTNLKL